MSICKGIVSDIKKISKALDYSLDDESIDFIATKNEEFILDILNESSQACIRDKRKIVSLEDLNEVINTRDLYICKDLLN